MPVWEQLLWVVFAVMMGGALVAGVAVAVGAIGEKRRYTAEQRIGVALGARSVPAEGTVLEVRRSDLQLTAPGSQGQRMVALELKLQLAPAAGAPTVMLRTMVDELLLPQLAVPGATIHLMQDPANPAVVAVDRQRTPLELPPARY